MARICFPCFLILFQIFLNFHLADSNETTQNQDCKDFTCGFLGTVGFPFYESSRPDCGLIKLDCAADSHHPTLDLHGKKYEVVEKDNYFLRVVDRDLESLLKNNSCQTFYKNLSLPESPVISYDVYHYLTLFRCDLGSDKTGLAGLGSYNKCSGHEGGGFVVFYKQHPYDDPINYGYVVDRATPAGCSRIELPIPLSTENKPNGDGPFGLLKSSFLLEWRVSGDCYECRDRGGRCIVDESNRYRCSKGKVNFRLLLRAVLGAVGCVVAIILVIFMVVRYKKWRRNSLYALSRNTSSDGGDPEGSHKDYGVPIFSHKELQKATNHFASSRELGDGGFGTVYYASKSEVQDMAISILRLRADLQSAVQSENYSLAADIRDQISKIEAESLAASVRAQAYENAQYAFRLGQRVRHKVFGYRGVICGMDPVCCESTSWMENAKIEKLSRGPDQPFYQVLVEIRADPNLLVTYVPEENLEAPSEEDTKRFDHPYTSFLFYGMDGAGDFIPIKQLREKYNRPRHELPYDPEDEKSGEDA